ncbi:MAG: hypothetical protein WA849_01255 [Candidatus Udaeobacter sp.]
MNHNVSAYVRNHKTTRTIKNRITTLLSAGIALFAVFSGVPLADADGFLPPQMHIYSTVPPNGDLNPYGVAFVPQGFQSGTGPLRPRQTLVSNFNNNMNLQGTGTTIVRVSSTGQPFVFFAGPPHPEGSTGLGLSTALAILQRGFVIVGNVPSIDGTSATAMPGSLLVINNQGHLVSAISGPLIKGPWDMTAIDDGNQAIAFVSMVLSGDVVRLNLDVSSTGVTVTSTTVIASGYAHRGDPAAFEVGPTGLVYDSTTDLLYVSSTADNAVFSIQNPRMRNSSGGKGTLVYSDAVHLHGPLAMATAPNGHLIVSNSDVINSNPRLPSEYVEFTKQGQFVSQLSIDFAQGGAFGLAVNSNAQESVFAAVDDNTATLIVWALP